MLCEEYENIKHKATPSIYLLGDSIVNTNSGQILGNKPLLTITFDDAALEKRTSYND